MQVNSASVKKKLIRNTLINFIIRFWGFAITFFLFYYIVKHIGEDDYGIYLFITAITGYFGILDLGIGNSLVKFVAEYHTKNDKERLNEVINTTFFIFLFIGILGAIILFLIGTFLLGYLEGIIPTTETLDFYPKARAVIYILGANFIFSLSLASLRGVLAGLQRYDILAGITFIMSLVNLGVVLLVLSLGYGLIELVFYTTCVGLLGFVMIIWYIHRLLPYVSIEFSYFRKDMFKTLFDLSISVFLLSMFVMIIYYTDRLVIGLFVGIGFITFYQAAWKIYGIPAKIPEIGLHAIIPAASELDVTKNLRVMRRLYLRGTKYVLALCLALAVPTLFLSKDILVLWMWEDYGEYYVIVWILMISLLFDFNNYVATQILIGMNKIKKFVKYYGIVAILNLGLSLFLVQQGYGLIGVALGTTIPFILLEVFFLRHVFITLDIKWRDYARQVVAKTYPYTVIAALVMYGVLLWRTPIIIGSHSDMFALIRDGIELGGYFAVGFGVYLALFYFLGLDPREKGDIKNIISKLISKLKRKKKLNSSS